MATENHLLNLGLKILFPTNYDITALTSQLSTDLLTPELTLQFMQQLIATDHLLQSYKITTRAITLTAHDESIPARLKTFFKHLLNQKNDLRLIQELIPTYALLIEQDRWNMPARLYAAITAKSYAALKEVEVELAALTPPISSGVLARQLSYYEDHLKEIKKLESFFSKLSSKKLLDITNPGLISDKEVITAARDFLHIESELLNFNLSFDEARTYLMTGDLPKRATHQAITDIGAFNLQLKYPPKDFYAAFDSLLQQGYLVTHIYNQDIVSVISYLKFMGVELPDEIHKALTLNWNVVGLVSSADRRQKQLNRTELKYRQAWAFRYAFGIRTAADERGYAEILPSTAYTTFFRGDQAFQNGFKFIDSKAIGLDPDMECWLRFTFGNRAELHVLPSRYFKALLPLFRMGIVFVPGFCYVGDDAAMLRLVTYYNGLGHGACLGDIRLRAVLSEELTKSVERAGSYTSIDFATINSLFSTFNHDICSMVTGGVRLHPNFLEFLEEAAKGVREVDNPSIETLYATAVKFRLKLPITVIDGEKTVSLYLRRPIIDPKTKLITEFTNTHKIPVNLNDVSWAASIAEAQEHLQNRGLFTNNALDNYIIYDKKGISCKASPCAWETFVKYYYDKAGYTEHGYLRCLREATDKERRGEHAFRVRNTTKYPSKDYTQTLKTMLEAIGKNTDKM